jgi:hypothetical protein
LIARIESEVSGHEDGTYEDEDLAYAIDVAYRIARGKIVAKGARDVRRAADELIARAKEVYPAIANYSPPSGQPTPTEIGEEIYERALAREEEEMDAASE